jgi:hypothetical protein
MMSGANESSVGSNSACGVTTTPGSAPIAPATLSWSDWRNVIRSSGVFDELACSASRCGSNELSNGRSASTTALDVDISAAPADFASMAK